MREGHGRPPVVQHLVRERLSFEERPDRSLEAISPEHLVYERPLVDDRPLRPRAVGVYIADPEAEELHRGFVPALPGLVSFYGTRESRSPGQAESTVARPEDLPALARLSETKLRIVGYLLEVEGVGAVSWTDDPASPWKIEVGYDILRYRRVVMFPDFVRVQSKVPSGAGD